MTRVGCNWSTTLSAEQGVDSHILDTSFGKLRLRLMNLNVRYKFMVNLISCRDEFLGSASCLCPLPMGNVCWTTNRLEFAFWIRLVIWTDAEICGSTPILHPDGLLLHKLIFRVRTPSYFRLSGGRVFLRVQSVLTALFLSWSVLKRLKCDWLRGVALGPDD